MDYIQFIRPDGQRELKSVQLSDKLEADAKWCQEFEDKSIGARGLRFTLEDCGPFINVCFEAEVTVLGCTETVDLVSEIFHEVTESDWEFVITKAKTRLELLDIEGP